MISVDWLSGVIFVPKADTTQIRPPPNEIRELNLDTFRLTLRGLEDDLDGRPWTPTHRHNTTVVVGGVTLARVVEILAPYTVTFEDGQYAVNLVGANSNVADVTNVNQVSVRPFNSAGLVQVGGGELTKADVDAAVWVESATGAQVASDADVAAVAASAAAVYAQDAKIAAEIARAGVSNSRLLYANGLMTLLADDGSVLYSFQALGPNGEPVQIPAGMPSQVIRIP